MRSAGAAQLCTRGAGRLALGLAERAILIGVEPGEEHGTHLLAFGLGGGTLGIAELAVLVGIKACQHLCAPVLILPGVLAAPRTAAEATIHAMMRAHRAQLVTG